MSEEMEMEGTMGFSKPLAAENSRHVVLNVKRLLSDDSKYRFMVIVLWGFANKRTSCRRDVCSVLPEEGSRN